MRYYWPSFFFFGIFVDREEFEVNKIAKLTYNYPADPRASR